MKQNFNAGGNGRNILEDGDITMTHSGVFSRNKQKVVHVCFERKVPGKQAFAEAVLPAGTFLHQEGFLQEEAEALKLYLQMNKEQIMDSARGINRDVLFRL